MPITITCPPQAQTFLRSKLNTYPPHGLGALTSVYLRDNKVSEERVRALASSRGTTITNIVRGLMCHTYPELKTLWPVSKPTAAQLAGIARRTKDPVDTRLQRAVDVIVSLLDDPDNGHLKRRAREFVETHKKG